MKQPHPRIATALFILPLLLPVLVFAALGERYEGRYEGEAVSVNFDTLPNGVTGVLTIGEVRYLLDAQKVEDGYRGKLFNIYGGQATPLLIREQDNGIEILIEENGRSAQHLQLQPTSPLPSIRR